MPIEIIIPGLILGGFALISSTGLLFASKKFHVEEDPRIEEVTEVLPGANCGGCGFAGCAAYAEHVVLNMNLDQPCPVADEATMHKVAEILGLEAPTSDKMVASLKCRGTDENTRKIMDYRGINDCWAAVLVADSTKSCAFACIGLGPCLGACNFDAMSIKDGIVEIDEEKCTGCGMCIDACPKHVLHMRPKGKNITVTCSNLDRGAAAKNACNVVCTGCQKCVKVCEADAISVNNFLASIDYDKCTLCGKCVDVCSTNAIEIKGHVVDA
jgi:RnfABCDGE-type electron transport complex B subunit